MSIKGYGTPTLLEGRHVLKMDMVDARARDKLIEDALKKGARVRFELSLEKRRGRSDGQLRLYWRGLTLLYVAVNGEWPNEAQKLDFHEDFKAEFALRRPSSLNPKTLIPIGLSESDSQDAAWLIDKLLQELGTYNLGASLQSEARDLLREFWAIGGIKYSNEAEFRETAKLCAACGRSGVDLAHMHSRGARPELKDDPENWIPLCRECHTEQHSIGVDRFLEKNKHLEKIWSGE